MKRSIALLCTVLLVFALPASAFGEPLDEGIVSVQPREAVNDLGAIDKYEDGSDPNTPYSLELPQPANLTSNGVVTGTIESLTITVSKAIPSSGYRGPNIAVPPKAMEPCVTDKAKTVLGATAFYFIFHMNKVDQLDPPGGATATIAYTYTPNQTFVTTLAKRYGIDPSDIELYVYEQKYDGTLLPLVPKNGASPSASARPAASSAEISINNFQSGTFVMALVCDTNLLNSTSVLTASGSGWLPPDEPAVVVAPGEDDSTTSPKTGQTIPAETAPLTLAVASVLGATALFTSRRFQRM